MMSVGSANYFYLLVVVFFSLGQCVLSKPVCPTGTYYDTSTRNCDSCIIICNGAEIQDTVEKCKNDCPGYSMTARTLRPLEDVSNPSNHWALILVVVIVSLVVIIAVGCLYKKNTYLVDLAKRRCNCFKRQNVPVQDHEKHDPEDHRMLETCLKQGEVEQIVATGSNQTHAEQNHIQIHAQETEQDAMLNDVSEQTATKFVNVPQLT